MTENKSHIIDELYLRDEDALLFDVSNDLECESELDPNYIKNLAKPVCLDDIELEIRPGANKHIPGTVNWLMKHIVNGLDAAQAKLMNSQKNLALGKPHITLIKGVVTLHVDEVLKSKMFGSLSCHDLVTGSISSDLRILCKDACLQESKYQTPSKTDELVRENIVIKTEAGFFKRSCLMGWENLDIVFESQFIQIFNKFFNEERFTTKSDEQV